MSASSPWVHGLLLAYPLLVHLAIVTTSDLFAWLALAVLAANLLAPWLTRDRSARRAWPALLLALFISGLLVEQADARLFLYAAPVLIALALAWFFGRTLLNGETPIIGRIAAAIRGPLPAPVARYTRHVTQFWTAVMLLMAAGNLVLALVATPTLWSLFTNFINYLLIAVLFVSEWLFRCWRLRAYESLTWWGYLGALRHINYRRLLHDE